jgi:hypothetical protein
MTPGFGTILRQVTCGDMIFEFAFNATLFDLIQQPSITPRSSPKTQPKHITTSRLHNRTVLARRPLRNAPHTNPPTLITNREPLPAIRTHHLTIPITTPIRSRSHIPIVAVVALLRFVLLRILLTGRRVRCQEWKTFHAICDCAGSSVDPGC